jgi:dTDP-4-amino-4,6-dideoxygalactose transaminase
VISYDGWDREWKQNSIQYETLFDKCMQLPYDGSVEFLETTMEIFSGRYYAVGVANATDALYFALVANGIGEGDEVLITDFSWISSGTCVTRAGATPVFCDIDIDTYHMSLDSIKRMVSDKTRALIYTHLYGSMSDTKEIEDWCRDKGILLIEDAAQSVGSSLDGRKAGTIGDCSVYSFNSNKVISGIAGGGMLLTNDEEVAEKVKSMRRHGKIKDDFVHAGSMNSKLYVPNAEVINFRMKNLTVWQLKRNEIAKEYDAAFKKLPLVTQAQKPRSTLQHNYHKYVVRFEDKDTRDFVRKAIKKSKKWNPNIHYDKPLTSQPVFGNIEYRSDKTPNAKLASETVVSLPIHPFMNDGEINTIIESIVGTL